MNIRYKELLDSANNLAININALYAAKCVDDSGLSGFLNSKEFDVLCSLLCSTHDSLGIPIDTLVDGILSAYNEGKSVNIDDLDTNKLLNLCFKVVFNA